MKPDARWQRIGELFFYFLFDVLVFVKVIVQIEHINARVQVSSGDLTQFMMIQYVWVDF